VAKDLVIGTTGKTAPLSGFDIKLNQKLEMGRITWQDIPCIFWADFQAQHRPPKNHSASKNLLCAT
jgi:hypothetical protein